jgi:phosphoglycerate dehydrogenase-like enzyme
MDAPRDILKEVDVVFSTWGFPKLNDHQLDMMPKLKAVFYAAGATSSFREPLQKRNIRICSATAANAIPVAEYALSHVLLAGAGFYRNTRECTDPFNASAVNSFRGHGNYANRVGILGNGSISKKLQEYLSHHELEVIEVASRVAKRIVSLEEAFSSCHAIVNLFPDVEDNGGVFDRALFSSMMDSAVFINCGRGRQVNESDLISVLKERPDLTAILDVQCPEPPEAESELYLLPNVCLSAHIAGSKATELVRMSDYMLEDFARFEQGERLVHEVLPRQI